MPRFRDQRVRVVLALIALSALGAASYFIGVSLWTNRKYNAACEALARYDYSQAGDLLDRYLFFHPNDSAALMLAAQTARRRGDSDEALRKLNLADKQGAPADVVALEKHLLRVQAGDLTDVGALTQVCTDHPAGPEAALILEALIEGSFKAFNPPLAKWGINLWLKHRPGKFDQAQGLIWHGRLSESVLDAPQALADYRRAVELDPDRLQARLLLVQVLVRAEPHEAISHLEWMRRHHPEDVEVRFQSARLCRHLGQSEEASRLLDAILAAMPDRAPVLLERGRVAMDLNRPEQAERWLRRAVALAPEWRDANAVMAACLRQTSRPEEAKRFQAKADEIEARLTKKLAELTGAE